MNYRFTLIALLSLLSLTARAETLYDADLALKAGDPDRALDILESLSGKHPSSSEAEGERLLKKAEVLESVRRTDEAEGTLKKIEGIPGLPPTIVGEAKYRHVRLLKNTRPKEAVRLATNGLNEVPGGKQGDAMRHLLATLLLAQGDPDRALALVSARPAAGRSPAFDALFAALARRLRLAAESRKRGSDPENARYAKRLKDAAALARKSSKNAARAYAAIADDVSAPAAARLEALVGRAACAEDAGDKGAAMETARKLAAFPAHVAPVPLTGGKIAAARLFLDLGGDAARSRELAEDAIAVVPPESDAAEEARWLLARTLVRQGAPVADIAEAVAASPAVKTCPFPADDPRHPVNRLVAAGGSLAKWMADDLHRPVPRYTNAVLRAADECFAAKRYSEAARRYARAADFGDPPPDALAYAALQRARASALSPEFKDAPGLYRKFLTDRALVRSDYAPDALLRAGVFCEGRLRDSKQGREFLRLAYERYPDTDSGQAALVYLAESLADSRDRAGAMKLYRDYLKKYPSGHYAGAAKKFLSQLEPKKK